MSSEKSDAAMLQEYFGDCRFPKLRFGLHVFMALGSGALVGMMVWMLTFAVMARIVYEMERANSTVMFLRVFDIISSVLPVLFGICVGLWVVWNIRDSETDFRLRDLANE